VQRFALLFNRIFSGGYAWLATVALPAATRGVGVAPRITAGAALASLLVGAWLSPRAPRLGRALGILAFVGLCTLSWLLMAPNIEPARLDRLRAALGGVGWLLFALAWGSIRDFGAVPEQDPHVLAGTRLAPRARLPLTAWAALGFGVAGALALPLLAWRVTEPGHALLAHAVALGCALALLACAAAVSVQHGTARPLPGPGARIERAGRLLAALTLALAIGFVWLLFS
jgi:hypothetical protein